MKLKQPFNAISHMMGGGLSIGATPFLIALADGPLALFTVALYAFLSRAAWQRLRIKPSAIGKPKKVFGIGGQHKVYPYGPAAITLRDETFAYRLQLDQIWHCDIALIENRSQNPPPHQGAQTDRAFS